MIRATCAALVLLLAGCSQATPPIFVTTKQPEIPPECSARCPPEPKLPLQDITDIDAAKDRSAMKKAFRCEKHQRATCASRLKVILK